MDALLSILKDPNTFNAGVFFLIFWLTYQVQLPGRKSPKKTVELPGKGK